MTDPAEGEEGLAPAEVRMIGVQLRLAPTGRPAQIQVPADITDTEAVSLVATLLAEILPRTRQAQPALLVPKHGLVLPS